MPRITRKTALTACTALVALVPFAAAAAECPDGFPSRPITLLVGFGAGGGTDSIARVLASTVERQNDWTIVVENRPGAGGGVMSSALSRATPDGYTIGAAGTDTIMIVPYTSGDVDFDHDDFDYLASAMQINLGFVTRAESPYDTVEELAEFAREHGIATVSVAGVNQEIAVRQIAEHFGVNMIPVPGQGAAEALQSALGGHVHATTQGTQHVQQIAAGRMKQLASMTDRRVPYAPDSPTLMELGIDVNLQAHTMFIAPKGLDAAIHSCLADAFDAAVQSEAYATLMGEFDNEPLNLGPERLREVVAEGAAFYRDMLAD